jgi:signal transduction histidine kinase
MSRWQRVAVVVSVLALSAYVLVVPRVDPTGSMRQSLADLVVSELVGLSFLLTGLFAWRRRPGNRTGFLMIIVGYAWFAETLAYIPSAATFTLGALVLPTIYLPALAHVMLAYPTGRLRSEAERVVIVVVYAATFLISVVCHLFSSPSPPCVYCQNLLFIRSSASLNERIREVSAVFAVALTVVVVVMIVVRWASVRGLSRRAMAPALWTSAVAGGFVLTIGMRDTFATTLPPTFYLYGYLTLAVLPLGFLIGLVHSRLARSAVSDALVELDPAPDLARLRDVLARAVGDPSLEVGVRSARSGLYVDGDERPVGLPAGPGRAVTAVGTDGDAVLIHDAALCDEPKLLAAVVAAARLSVEHGRLEHQIRAQAAEADALGRRIVEASDAERRRLERDLHDGAQQRLVALAMTLHEATGRVDEGDLALAAALTRAARDAGDALTELRELARGLHPAVLTQSGLAGGLLALVERCPVPARLLAVPAERFAEPVETTAYFVVSEALANVAKHAHAQLVTVTATLDSDRLRVEVCDDGVGGASLDAGVGLRGLADRVATTGGRLLLDSRPGSGTRLLAEMPVA